MKTEFYDLLNKDEAFCSALGKVMLSASKLEILLKQYLQVNGIDVPEKKATLGNLIRILKDNDHLTKNGEIHFGQVNLQRNYLIHNLYGSFVDEITHKILPTEQLVPEDVEIYTEKTLVMVENLECYAGIVSRAIEKHNKVIKNRPTKSVGLDAQKAARLL